MPSEVMSRIALRGPPWICGWACPSPVIPREVTSPLGIGRLGIPPGETLICRTAAEDTLHLSSRTTQRGAIMFLRCALHALCAPTYHRAQRRGGLKPAAGLETCPTRLNVVIQGELVGMRAQADGVGFVLALVGD